MSELSKRFFSSIFLLIIIYLSLSHSVFLFIFLSLISLLICSLTDIGGYLVGKSVGGKKINKISPKKTYSGVVGSFILPLIICYLFDIYLNDQSNFSFNVITIIISVSFISQLGDLLISFLKRKAKIKDTGNIIPGHGGILDRIDGILLGLPLGIYLISI